MRIVFYSTNSQFQLTDEEFDAFIKAVQSNKGVWIPRLEAFLTDKFIWAGKQPADLKRIALHDGGYAIWHNFAWRPEKNLEAKLDLSFYPEVLKDIDIKEPHKQIKSGN